MRIVSSAQPFDPAAARRRFVIGAPDAISAVLLPELLAALRKEGPGIDIGVRQVPPETPGTKDSAWDPGLAGLDARTFDLALLPLGDVPARFTSRRLYEEDFVIASRAGHPFAHKPSLNAFCRAEHLVVSLTGDPHGFVDEALARKKRSRRVVVTVPSFSMRLALIAESDLIAAIPRRLVARSARRMGVVATEAPLPLLVRSDPVFVIATRAAMLDAGVAWLFGQLEQAARSAKIAA